MGTRTLRSALLMAAVCGAALRLGACGSEPDGSSDAAAEGTSTAELHPCDLDAGPGWRCGKITVPAVRSDPDIGEETIRFSLLPRSDRERPRLRPIFFVEGGPGYASAGFDSAGSTRAAFGPLLKRRDLIAIDQRGTGGSGVVDCPGLQRDRINEQIATAECANQLGDRYQGFTTAESAADIDAVRESLGLDRITLYGDSYGTLLGQAYSIRYGDNLGALVLSSPYPADDPFWRTLYPAGVHALKASCERSQGCRGHAAASCGQAFPCSWNAADRFREVMRRLQHEEGQNDDLVLVLLEAGSFSPGSYLEINRAVTDYLGGDEAPLTELIDPGAPGGGDPAYFSYGMAQAFECNDYPMPWDRSAGFNERVAQLNDEIRDFPDRDLFDPLSVRQWMMMPASGLVDCLAWPPPTDEMEPPLPEGDEQPADLPVLIVEGEFDDITSVKEAHQVAATFPDSKLFIVPQGGHAPDLYHPYTSASVPRIRDFIASN